MKYNNEIPIRNIAVARKTSMIPFRVTVKDKEGVAVDLTGWTAEAEVRRGAGQAVLIDMQPNISDASNGVIDFVNVDQNATDIPAGKYYWDFVLIDNTGNARGVFLTGKFEVYDKITDSSVT